MDSFFLSLLSAHSRFHTTRVPRDAKKAAWILTGSGADAECAAMSQTNGKIEAAETAPISWQPLALSTSRLLLLARGGATVSLQSWGWGCCLGGF